ncbi:MAG: chemotaxis protein CheA [Gammaproteobacteria bacterium]|nr:chemotaxis protein CheA [Gammaproteobacteria bacterium]
MSIDISQFLNVFYEESFEGLAVMEQGLLGLDPDAVDGEAINAIFRAAHSIKGGAGTFGLNEVSEFTHTMETLLDEIRDGARGVTTSSINVLLRATDCIQHLLKASQEGSDVDQATIETVSSELEQLLSSEDETDSDKVSVDPHGDSLDQTLQIDSESMRVWSISFKPAPYLFTTGNDPVRLFSELADMGDVDIVTHTSRLPDFNDLDPEQCYLDWSLTLRASVEKSAIEEVFEWVEGDCELSIELSQDTALEKTMVTDETASEPESAPAENGPSPIKDTQTRAPQQKTTQAKAQKKANVAENSSIRVGIDKVDHLINLVGELVITQSMLGQLGEVFEINALEQLKDGLAQFERNTRELQESVMRIRMIPISFAFNRFPRLVHDVSAKLGKKVDLQVSGEETEVDKTVIEKIIDPLVHLVRNAVDHGIEAPNARLASGKPEAGTVTLSAAHRGGNIVIEITDDGAGLKREKILGKAFEKQIITEDDGERMTDDDVYNLIFHPGFSTADTISDVSGRGVGMDVVRSNIRELGGTVEINSTEGQGSTILVRLPLTLAILDGQTVAIGEETYIVPLASIIESIQIKPSQINMVAGKGETFKLRDSFIPIVRLHDIFDIKNSIQELSEGLLVIVEDSNGPKGIFVDRLLGQQQVVIKSLDANYKKIPGFSGATILGDGSVALIIDIPEMLRLATQSGPAITYPLTA